MRGLRGWMGSTGWILYSFCRFYEVQSVDFRAHFDSKDRLKFYTKI